MGNDQQPLVEVKNLKKWFPLGKGFLQRSIAYVKAVDDVNLHVVKAVLARPPWGAA